MDNVKRYEDLSKQVAGKIEEIACAKRYNLETDELLKNYRELHAMMQDSLEWSEDEERELMEKVNEFGE